MLISLVETKLTVSLYMCSSTKEQFLKLMDLFVICNIYPIIYACAVLHKEKFLTLLDPFVIHNIYPIIYTWQFYVRNSS